MAQSPYEVPVMSVADAPVPHGPLQPYEQTQLRLLVNQFKGTAPRIQAAFLEEVAPGHLPKVVRLRG